MNCARFDGRPAPATPPPSSGAASVLPVARTLCLEGVYPGSPPSAW